MKAQDATDSKKRRNADRPFPTLRYVSDIRNLVKSIAQPGQIEGWIDALHKIYLDNDLLLGDLLRQIGAVEKKTRASTADNPAAGPNAPTIDFLLSDREDIRRLAEQLVSKLGEERKVTDSFYKSRSTWIHNLPSMIKGNNTPLSKSDQDRLKKAISSDGLWTPFSSATKRLARALASLFSSASRHTLSSQGDLDVTDYHKALGSMTALLLSVQDSVAETQTAIARLADNIAHAPMLVSKSFAEWKEMFKGSLRERVSAARNSLKNQIAFLTGSENLVRAFVSLEPFFASFDLRMELAARSKSRGVKGKILEWFSGAKSSNNGENAPTEILTKCFENVSRSQGWIAKCDSLQETFDSSLLRLSIAQAAMPSMPEDWFKPVGWLLLLLVTCALGYFGLSAIVFLTPFWSIASKEDVLALVAHPAYICAVLIVFASSVTAVRGVARRISQDCKNELDRLWGRPISTPTATLGREPREETAGQRGESVLKRFDMTVRNAVIVAFLVAGLGPVASWKVWPKAPETALAVHGDTECKHLNFAQFGNGVAIWDTASGIQLYPQKDAATLLCRKATETHEHEEKGRDLVLLASDNVEKATVTSDTRRLGSEVGHGGTPTSSVRVSGTKEPELPLRVSIDEFLLCGKNDKDKTCPLETMISSLSRISEALEHMGLASKGAGERAEGERDGQHSKEKGNVSYLSQIHDDLLALGAEIRGYRAEGPIDRFQGVKKDASHNGDGEQRH